MLRKKKVKTGNSLLQRFGLFFYNKKETTILYWLAIVVFGIVSYTSLLPRQGFPNVSAPFSVITGTYLVGDKAIVDKDVVQPLHDVVKQVASVKKIQSQANDNFFVVTVEHKDGVSSEVANQSLKDAVSTSGKIPATAALEYRPIDAGRFRDQSDLLIAVYAKQDTDTKTIGTYATRIAEELDKKEAVDQAFYIDQYETGKNPVNGETVTLQTGFDIAGVKDGIGQIHIHRSVLIGVKAASGADAFDVYDAANETISAIRANADFKDYDIVVVADFAEGITAQISSLQQSLLEGLIVVVIVSFILISWRAGLATALSMVTVLLATVGILYAIGTSLNTITLFALILSLGLIVDDTTIMVEAIDAAKKKHGKKQEVVANAIKKVARASFAGTLTTMFGFAPMLFIGGILGDFIRILPVTIIIALAMSLLISLTLVPFFAHFLLAGADGHTSFVGRIEQTVSGWLVYLLQATKRSKIRRFATTAVALGLSLIMLVGSVVFAGKLKFDIFPTTKDTDGISVAVSLPQGTTIEQSEAKVTEIVTKASDTLGSNFKRLSLQGTGDASGGTAVFDLIPYDEREVTAPQLVTKLEQAIGSDPLALVRVSQVDVGPPKDAFPFGVRVLAEDPEQATKLLQSMELYLKDKSIKRLNGTTFSVVRTELRTDSIKRADGKRYVELRAGFSDTDVSALTTATQTELEKEFGADKIVSFNIAKDDVVYDFGNESDNQDSFKSMLIAFPILLVAMYLLLALQFKSLLQPLLIFAAIPYSFFGVAAGLHYTNNPLSFFVMIGFFALIGIAVNNTILLVDYANQARQEGAGPTDAIAMAIRERFRPLITTSLTSVVALIPLALSDPFWESLAYTLIFGLLSSTFLVVLAFPYAYLVAEWLRSKIRFRRKHV